MNENLLTSDTSIVTHLDSHEARDLTDKIRAGLEGVFELIKSAYSGFAWKALGYASWDEYVQREFGNLSLRPPREYRDEIIGSMRAAGMSVRAIATATQLGRDTVHRELSSPGVRNRTPVHADGTEPGNGIDETRILGQDGRQYPAHKPAPDMPDTFPSEPIEQLPGQTVVDDVIDVPGTDVDLDAVLDAPAEDVGIKPLDVAEMQSARDARTVKLLDAFHGNDIGSLPRTMQLAEQISGLVSPLDWDISVDDEDYESLTKGVSAAVRQFAYVIKTLSQAAADFDSERTSALVVDDLQAAVKFLRDSVREMESK